MAAVLVKSFATRFYEATKGIAALAALVGHRDLKTVMCYVPISQDQQKRAMAVWSEPRASKKFTQVVRSHTPAAICRALPQAAKVALLWTCWLPRLWNLEDTNCANTRCLNRGRTVFS